MATTFDLDHARLAADPRFADIGHELSALSETRLTLLRRDRIGFIF